MSSDPKPASPHTRSANAGVKIDLDPVDFERASRGLVARHATGRIEGPFGPAWDLARYAFLAGDAPAPDTVNPSLWRQAQLNAIHGLFEVAPGLWQARGYDISNVTFIAGDERLGRDRPADQSRRARARVSRSRTSSSARDRSRP